MSSDEQQAAPVDDELEPSLFQAVRADDAVQVAALVAAGADLTTQLPPFGWTALHIAAGEGKMNATAALLDAGAEVDSRANDGETPLHLAAQAGSDEEIRLLVDRRADVEARSNEGETPLHVAVQHIGSRSPQHIDTLLSLRADPGVKDSDGRDAFEHARILTNRGEEISAVLAAGSQRADGGDAAAAAEAWAGRAAAARQARGGAAAEFDGALKAACKKGEAECVRQLLRWSPDPAGSAMRALVPAAAGGNVEVAEALVAVGADIRCSVPDEASGSTPLIAAADENMSKMVRWLLNQKADPLAASRDGATALMAAAMRGSTEITTMLLASGADTEQRANGGWTALMVACQAGRLDVARVLLDAKANLETANADGATARALASAGSHTELIKLLDTRARLTARRAKTAQKGGGQVISVTEESKKDDTRDLEALLAALGEPNTKAAKKAAKAKEEAAKANEEAAKVAPAAAAPKAATAPKAAAAAPAPKAKSRAKSDQRKRTPEEAAKVKALQERSKELGKQRAIIDAEDAEVLRQLAELGA